MPTSDGHEKSIGNNSPESIHTQKVSKSREFIENKKKALEQVHDEAEKAIEDHQ